jgi:hypothetical protein
MVSLLVTPMVGGVVVVVQEVVPDVTMDKKKQAKKLDIKPFKPSRRGSMKMDTVIIPSKTEVWEWSDQVPCKPLRRGSMKVATTVSCPARMTDSATAA